MLKLTKSVQVVFKLLFFSLPSVGLTFHSQYEMILDSCYLGPIMPAACLAPTHASIWLAEALTL